MYQKHLLFNIKGTLQHFIEKLDWVKVVAFSVVYI